MGNPANTDPVHTDQTEILDWEKFELVALDEEQGFYAFKTVNGNLVTAVNGGGIGDPSNQLPMHTDTLQPSTWGQFILVPIDEDDKK
ncbi:MAG TPA: hypothetical protein VNO50_05510 [Pyrinomonadaceae bacterium]|nr:hypothetical protein [Pyrinomonadaceae bacterium]